MDRRELTSMSKHVQPLGFNHWLWTTTESVEVVKHNQILPLSLPKQNCPNMPKETLKFFTYFWMGLG